MERRGTFVVLDSTSERGRLWQRITGQTSFTATPPIDGFYRLDIEQFSDAVFAAICAELAQRFGATQAEVEADLVGHGFIPLRAGPDATFGAELRMLM